LKKRREGTSPGKAGKKQKRFCLSHVQRGGIRGRIHGLDSVPKEAGAEKKNCKVEKGMHRRGGNINIKKEVPGPKREKGKNWKAESGRLLKKNVLTGKRGGNGEKGAGGEGYQEASVSHLWRGSLQKSGGPWKKKKRLS